MPDVYDAPQLSGLGGIAIIRPGEQTEYRQAPRGVGSGGDLVDQAIQARQNFENRRRYLISQIPYANRRQGVAIAAELHAIDADQRQLNFESNQRRVMAHTDAVEADRRWKMERETEIDEHGAAMIQGLGVLRGALRNGRITQEQYHDGLLDLGQKYPYAMRHPEAAKRYEFDVSEADKMRDFAQRRDISEASKLASKYGIQPTVNPATGLPDLDAMRQAVLSTPKGQTDALSTLNTQMVKRYGLSLPSVFEHSAGGRMDDPSKPETFKQTDPNDTQNPQTHVRVDVISPAGTVHPLVMEKPRFDAIKSEFEPQFNAILSARQAGEPAPNTQTQPAAADPRTELAQKALNDPAASQAHKAAARKILGIEENASE